MQGVDIDLQGGTDPNEWGYNYLPEVSFREKQARFLTVQALKRGDATAADLDAAVSRILTLKFAAHLFDQNASLPVRTTASFCFDNAIQEQALAVLQSPAHLAIARQAAEESVVLAVNNKDTLPLISKPGNRFESCNML